MMYGLILPLRLSNARNCLRLVCRVIGSNHRAANTETFDNDVSTETPLSCFPLTSAWLDFTEKININNNINNNNLRYPCGKVNISSQFSR
jgi:hypothetical protein